MGLNACLYVCMYVDLLGLHFYGIPTFVLYISVYGVQEGGRTGTDSIWRWYNKSLSSKAAQIPSRLLSSLFLMLWSHDTCCSSLELVILLDSVVAPPNAMDRRQMSYCPLAGDSLEPCPFALSSQQ